MFTADVQKRVDAISLRGLRDVRSLEKRRKPRRLCAARRLLNRDLSVTMTIQSATVNEGFDRLQRLLLAMHVGDEVRPMDVAVETGLSAETCRAVLLGLERAGLMTRREDDRFTRRRLQLGV